MTECTTRAIDEAFLDAMLADEDILNAAFEAIISAEWPTAKPPQPPARQRHKPVRSKRGRTAESVASIEHDHNGQAPKPGPRNAPRLFRSHSQPTEGR
jgi:hypothetical protein